MEIKLAKVIDNVDKDKTGKLKLRIVPEMSGVDESNLPWCRPFLLQGNGSKTGTHTIPEKGDMIKVIIKDKFWKNIEWLNGDFVDGMYPYETWTNKSSSISELQSMTYPQPSFMRVLPDQSIMFYNSETGEAGYLNSSGSYTIFDSSGNIIQNANTSKFTIKTSTKSLKTDILKVILESLLYILGGGLTTGAGPAVPADASKVRDIITAKITLDNIFKD